MGIDNIRIYPGIICTATRKLETDSLSAIVNSVSHVGPYSIALKYSKVQNPLNGNKIVLQTVTRESSRLQKAGRSVKDLDACE